MRNRVCLFFMIAICNLSIGQSIDWPNGFDPVEESGVVFMGSGVSKEVKLQYLQYKNDQNLIEYLKGNWRSKIGLFLVGFSDGTADVLQFKYKGSIFPQEGGGEQYWNPSLSWRNKYSGGIPSNGEKFFGSTTFAVALTDGWHNAKFWRNKSMNYSIYVHRPPPKGKEWYFLIEILVDTGIQSLGWHVANEVLIRRR
jgi:hypothetical protein